MPTMPVTEAGWRMNRRIGAGGAHRKRAATAADEPLDDPPGTSLRGAFAGSLPDQGLIVG